MNEDWAECRRLLAQHSKSFTLATRLLRKDLRDEVAALYAWCRRCDDAIDLAPGREHPRAMTRLREELQSVYAGLPQSEVVLACFQEVVRRREIPMAYPVELLAGMQMDIDRVPYATTDDLLVYCWRVAGTVGLMMCHVLGVSDRRAGPHAAHLGIGMQLTNIARDVAEDWERGRLYVPEEMLGASVRDHLVQDSTLGPISSLSIDQRADLAVGVRRVLSLADSYYASADRGLGFLEPRSALAIRTAKSVYSEIGRVVVGTGCDVSAGRAVVTTRRKLILALGAVARFTTDYVSWNARDLRAPDGILDRTEALRLS